MTFLQVCLAIFFMIWCPAIAFVFIKQPFDDDEPSYLEMAKDVVSDDASKIIDLNLRTRALAALAKEHTFDGINKIHAGILSVIQNQKGT